VPQAIGPASRSGLGPIPEVVFELDGVVRTLELKQLVGGPRGVQEVATCPFEQSCAGATNPIRPRLGFPPCATAPFAREHPVAAPTPFYKQASSVLGCAAQRLRTPASVRLARIDKNGMIGTLYLA
jgi:hypothetical protein